MIETLRRQAENRFGSLEMGRAGVVAAVLLAAAYLGSHARASYLALIGGAGGAIILLLEPCLGFPVAVVAALIGHIKISTGTEVSLNPVTLLIPALIAVWVLRMLRDRELRLAQSRVNRPLFLFLAAGLLSLFLGTVLWDPSVPHSSRFILVQLCQWGIFALAGGALLLTGNLVTDIRWLKWLTVTFLLVGAALAAVMIALSRSFAIETFATEAVSRAPFWLLLTSVAGGQLLFNGNLKLVVRLFLAGVVAAAFYYVFTAERDVLSVWSGVVVALAMLAWLRWPRLRWPVVVLAIVSIVAGQLLTSVWAFAGGEAEWSLSGGSRLALSGRVVEVTLRNPITGLGPAAYRAYARMKPLSYGGAYWIDPLVSSHNNYVDLFSHVGLVGLGLFLWFMAELGLLAARLRERFSSGFAAGYLNGALAAWVASLVVMVLADWLLPYVYNIGFEGFQAAVLVWFFLGGVIALEQMPAPARVPTP